MILSYLESTSAGTILAGLPHEIQPEVTRRIALMEKVTPDVLREVERVLERKLSTIATEDYMLAGGLDTVSQILSNVDRGAEKIIMEALGQHDPELAKNIRYNMYIFEDISLIDDNSIKKILERKNNQGFGRVGAFEA